MSNTSTKSLLLSQLKIGKAETYYPAVLQHTSTVREDGTEYKIEIPGVDPATVEVNAEETILTVTCPSGELTVPINSNVDTSKIKADILWGMLTILVPSPVTPIAHSIKIGIHDSVKKSPVTKTSEKFTSEH